MCRISVIMPVYNGERYLAEAIESVLNQSFRDFELLIIDDGSTDNSARIIEDYAKKDNRIRPISQANSGVSTARNNGMKNACGNWICFLDCDDLYMPNYLERMITAAEENHADVICCNFEMGYTYSGDLNTDSKKISEEYKKTYGCAAFGRLCSQGLGTSPWLKLISKKLISANGVNLKISFDPNMTYGEDMFFCWKVIMSADRIFSITDKLYFYRQTRESATLRLHRNLYEKYAKAYDDLIKFAKENGLYEPKLFDEICISFAQRLPALLRMTIREKMSPKKTFERLHQIINDEKISRGLHELYDSTAEGAEGFSTKQYNYAAKGWFLRLYASAVYCECRFKLARKLKGK